MNEPDASRDRSFEDDPRAPYVYDSLLIGDLASLVDQACVGAEDPHDVCFRTQALAAELESRLPASAVAALGDTFLYMIRAEPVGAPQAGATLEPMDDNSLFPPALRQASEDVRRLWVGLAERVTHPLALARCWDIVFTLGLVPNKRTAAENAAQAYLASVTNDPQTFDSKAEGLLRAWTLTRKMRLGALANSLKTVMIAAAEEAISRGEDAYAVLDLVNALTAPDRRERSVAHPEGIRLLERALAEYQQVRVIGQFAALARVRAGADRARAEAASRREVGAMLAEARAAADPMVIRKLFGDAASAARHLGLPDLEHTAVAHLQSAPSVAWGSIEFSAVIPTTLVRGYLPGFDDAVDWRRALVIWLNTTCPSGKLEANTASARAMAEVSVFASLMTTVIYRDGDLPTRTLDGEDERFGHQLVEVEEHNLRTHGQLLAQALQEIRDRFGIPSHCELVKFLDGFGSAASYNNDLATALHQYWLGDYSSCVHRVVPKIESSVRAILLELNEPIYRAQVGSAPGQFPGLGALLPHLLDCGFDPDWERFLRTLLLGDGWNLRNLVAHGFVQEPDPMITVLALRAAACTFLLTNHDEARRDSMSIQERLDLAAPVRPPRGRLHRLRDALVAALNEFRP